MEENTLNEKLEFLKEKTRYFHKLANDEKFLFDEVNNLKNNKGILNELSKIYESGKATKFVRYMILQYISKGLEINLERIEEIKQIWFEIANEKIAENYTEIFDIPKHVIQEIIQEHKNKKGEEKKDPFKSLWKTPFNFCYVFFYRNDEVIKEIQNYLKEIGNFYIDKLNLQDSYTIKIVDFDAPMVNGQEQVGVYLYPKQLEDYKYAMQFAFEINNGSYCTKKQKGKEVKIKGINYEAEHPLTINESIDYFNRIKENIVEENEKIIAMKKGNHQKSTNENITTEKLEQNGEAIMPTNTQPALNQILYGPPGTGKTYNTVIEAIKIIDNTIIKYDEQGKVINYPELKKKFDEYKKQGRIEFITFHQSYSYEEFVEGIKPDLGDNSKDLKYKLKDGIFKRMCKPIATYEDFKKLFDEKLIQRTFKTSTDNEFEIVACDDSCIQTKRNSEEQVRPIKVENFEQALKNEYDYKADTDGQLRTIIDYINGKRVLIIDEINRGNISKIFGELITLIEEDKRENVTGDDERKYNTVEVKLPYSNEPFTVPNNLYIIGTMNTADKSLALLDVALRRRFEFVPMYPNKDLITNKYTDFRDKQIFLEKINEKIEHDKKSADYLIGHAYFMNNDSFVDVLNKKIIPLLLEYYNGKQDTVETNLGTIFEYDLWKRYKTKKEHSYLQVSKVDTEEIKAGKENGKEEIANNDGNK